MGLFISYIYHKALYPKLVKINPKLVKITPVVFATGNLLQLLIDHDM